MDAVETPPPIHLLKKQKRAILHDVIDIDDDDDSEDLVLIGEKVSKSNKGKTIEAIHQVMEVSTSFGSKNHGLAGNLEARMLLHAGNLPATTSNAILHDVIDIDDDDDSEDLVIIGEKVSKSNKGKTIEAIRQDVEVSARFGSINDGLTINLEAMMLLHAGNRSAATKGKTIDAIRQAVEVSARFGSINDGLTSNLEAMMLLHAGNLSAATKFKSSKKAFGSSSSCHSNVKHEILRKFQSFKQFDTVNDASGDHFFHKKSSMKQHPKNWAKEIQKEWKILEKHLPDSIFVRAYESRMDLLRAVIIGAEGTPYHDALFFFDVYFPSYYPIVPPLVYFHSRGFCLNPNLYSYGEVCVSLLNTWHGSGTECWLPHVSTILQVLVSIQGLILNKNPFFNGPGRERMTNLAKAESMSLQYNKDTFIQSLWMMIHMIRRPPKNFEDFVVGHFISRAHDILRACNAYMEGAQVGCLVKGGVQDDILRACNAYMEGAQVGCLVKGGVLDVDEGDKRFSREFKNALAECMKELVREWNNWS